MDNKNLIILALVGILLVVLMTKSGCGDDPEPIITARPVPQIQKEVVQDSIRIHKVLDSMKRIETSLTKKITASKNDLKVAERMVVELLNDAGTIIFTDTGRAQLAILKQANKTKDSIVRVVIASQDSTITNLQAQNEARQELYSNLRRSFNEVATGSLQKDTLISFLQKKVRKEKRKTALFKVVAGAAIILFVKETLK